MISNEEAVAHLRDEHYEAMWAPGNCAGCGFVWPCPTVVALDQLEAAEAKNDALRDQGCEDCEAGVGDLTEHAEFKNWWRCGSCCNAVEAKREAAVERARTLDQRLMDTQRGYLSDVDRWERAVLTAEERARVAEADADQLAAILTTTHASSSDFVYAGREAVAVHVEAVKQRKVEE